MERILSDGTMLAGQFHETDSYRIRRPAGADSWLIVYTLEGEGYFRVPSGEYRCRPGEIGLLGRGVPHEYGTCKGRRWHFMWAHFAGIPETTLLPDDEVLICPMPTGQVQRRIVRSFRSLLEDSRERSAYWQSLCELQLRGLLLLVARQLTVELDARVAHVMRIMSERMTEPLSIDLFAAEVGLSASRLSHLFKEETGRSILAALNDMRLEQAGLLMLHAGRTATEAALDVGFASYNHFAALFRKRYGVSPTKYRQGQASSVHH